MVKKKVINRKLTNNGILFTFEDDTVMLLTPTKLETLKMVGVSIPNTGQEIEVKPSTDQLGNESDTWVDWAL